MRKNIFENSPNNLVSMSTCSSILDLKINLLGAQNNNFFDEKKNTFKTNFCIFFYII